MRFGVSGAVILIVAAVATLTAVVNVVLSGVATHVLVIAATCCGVTGGVIVVVNVPTLITIVADRVVSASASVDVRGEVVVVVVVVVVSREKGNV